MNQINKIDASLKKYNKSLSFKGRDGSIKFIASKVVKTFNCKLKFDQERDILQLLSSSDFPNSPKYINSDVDKLSITMEKIEGETLFDFLLKASLKQIEWVEQQIKIALLKLAENGVFHGDINRGNIIVTNKTSGKSPKIIIIDYAESKKIKTSDPHQLADDMLFRKKLIMILDYFKQNSVS